MSFVERLETVSVLRGRQSPSRVLLGPLAIPGAEYLRLHGTGWRAVVRGLAGWPRFYWWRAREWRRRWAATLVVKRPTSARRAPAEDSGPRCGAYAAGPPSRRTA
jgi:hypothetical protein